MSRTKLTKVGIVFAIAGALGLRAWWYWPITLPGGRLLEKIEVRGGDYTLLPKVSARMEEIVNTKVFGGYHPSTHHEYKESKEDSPSRFVSEDKYHSYQEYVTRNGRLQLHWAWHPSSEYESASDSEWMEFLPTDLPVDRFFSTEIAVNLDLSAPNFKVYIPHKAQDMYMTVTVKDRKVENVFWAPHP